MAKPHGVRISYEDIKCKVCPRVFTPSRKDNIYCSDVCKTTAYYLRKNGSLHAQIKTSDGKLTPMSKELTTAAAKRELKQIIKSARDAERRVGVTSAEVQEIKDRLDSVITVLKRS